MDINMIEYLQDTLLERNDCTVVIDGDKNIVFVLSHKRGS